MAPSIFRFIVNRPAQKIAEAAVSANTVGSHVDDASPTPLLRNLLRLRNANPPDLAGMKKLSTDFLDPNSKEYVNRPEKVSEPLNKMLQWITEQRTSAGTAAFVKFAKSTLPGTIAAFVKTKGYLTDRERIGDSLLAHHIAGTEKGRVPPHLTRLLRLCGTLERLARAETALDESGGISRAMRAFVLLPRALYPLPKSPDPQDAANAEAYEKVSKAREARRAELEKIGDEIGKTETAIREVLTGYDNDMAEALSTHSEPLVLGDLDARPAAAKPGPASSILSEAQTKAISQPSKAVIADLKLNAKEINVIETTARLERRVAELSRSLYEGASESAFVMIGSSLVSARDFAGSTGTFELPDRNAGCPLPGDCRVEEPDDPAADTEIPAGPGDAATMKATFGELMVVEQTLKRYELGEIAHVENILRGEERKRVHRRAQTTEDIVVLETETVEESERDLQSTERFELQTESERILTEDTAREAGLKVSGKYGPTVDFAADASYSRDTSIEDAHRTATNYSREVTERAVSRIQERVLESRTQRTLLEVEEKNIHAFNNTTGTDNVAGIYRWLNKIYESRVVNYGQRAMFELVIPEPATFLKYAMAAQAHADVDLVKPSPPGYCPGTSRRFKALVPQDLCASNYMYWVAKYGVPGVEPPPPAFRIVGKSFDNSNVQNQFDTISDGEIRVPEGYVAKRAWIVDGRLAEGGTQPPYILEAYVGRRYLNDMPGQNNAALSNEDGDLPVSVMVANLTAYVVNIEVECRRTQAKYAEWQLATFNAIMLAYQEQLAEYEDRVAAQAISDEDRIEGSNPLRNQALIRDELKRASISVFTGQHFDAFTAMRRGVGGLGYPQLSLTRVAEEGPYIRFFEQAFEWEHIAYVFYPYYWGRKDRWPENVLLDDADPLFGDFLRAGAARVVVPVRPNFEIAVASYLNNGWLLMDSEDTAFPDDDVESDLPLLDLVTEVQAQQGYDGTPGVGTVSVTAGSDAVTGTDTIFSQLRDIGREIHIGGGKYRITAVTSATAITIDRNYEGASATDIRYALGPKTVGEPWEVQVPTSLVYLENDSTTLPTFD